MAGRVDDARFERADANRVALADSLVDMSDALCFVARRDDAAMMMLFERADSLV